MDALVQGRDCGGCSVCCTALFVDTPQLQKNAGAPCRHCDAQGGCGIYQTRFPICRDWFCGWRHAAWLDDWWRPDRCGVLIYPYDSFYPPEDPRYGAVTFKIVGDPKVLEDLRFVEAVYRLVSAGAIVYLAAMEESGMQPGRVLLSAGPPAAEILGGNYEPIVEVLKSAYQAALAQPRREAVFAHDGNRC